MRWPWQRKPETVPVWTGTAWLAAPVYDDGTEGRPMPVQARIVGSGIVCRTPSITQPAGVVTQARIWSSEWSYATPIMLPEALTPNATLSLEMKLALV